jgi:undecaprenyl-diphosphatase
MEDHPVVDAIAAILMAIGLGLFVALAVPSLATSVQQVDDAVWGWAVDAEWAPAVVLAKGLDLLGRTWVTAPIMAAIALLLVWRRRWKTLSFWVVAMAASQLLIGPMKGLYERDRPPNPLVATNDLSFPSGHAVATAAIAIALVIVFVPSGPKRRNLELVAAAVAILMAASRVYLRAHWSTDALAGAALGAAVVIVTAAMVSRVAARIVESRSSP